MKVWGSHEHVLRNLYLFNEDVVYEMFVLYHRRTVSKIRVRHLPILDPQSPRVEAVDVSLFETVTRIIDLYNELVFHSDSDAMIFVREFTTWLANNEVYKQYPGALVAALTYYAEALQDIPEQDKIEVSDFLRYAHYLPIMKLQCKKQKLITGTDSEGRYIYNNIKVMYPTLDTMMRIKTFGENIDWKQFNLNSLIQAGAHYFVFPLMVMSRTFDESHQDLLPLVWSHPTFMEMRDVPKIEEKWREHFYYAKTNRVYALPEEGVLVDCVNYGDVSAITLKEVSSGQNERLDVIYAKVSFDDETDDIVIFNLDLMVPISSGYGDIFGFENDRVLDLVAKAYRDLVSKQKIVHSHPMTPKERKHESEAIARTSRSPSFVYIPRTVYEGNHVSPIRRR